MQIANERRGQPRATLETTVIAFIGDERIECRAIDISANGIALLSPVVRSNGQFLRVNFALPQANGPRWLDADGVVARVARAEQGILLGVQFLVIEDRAAREVHAYVEHTRLVVAQARQQEVYVRRVAGSSASSMPIAAPIAARTTAEDGRMPDANHPPRVTGEFVPAQLQQPRRTTQEYAHADDPSASSSSRPAAEAVGTAATLESPRATESTSGGRWPGDTPNEGTSSHASSSGRWPGETAGDGGASSHSSGTGRFPGEAAGGARTATGSTTRHESSGGQPRRATRPPEGPPNDPARRPTPTSAAARPAAPAVSRSDLAALYRDALDEVDGSKKKKKK